MTSQAQVDNRRADPLDGPVAERLRSRDFDDVDILALFDTMEAEIRVHRKTFCTDQSRTHTMAQEGNVNIPEKSHSIMPTLHLQREGIPHELSALGAAIGKGDNDNDGGSVFNRAMGLPSSNPKRAFGVKKPSAQFIPPVAIVEESVVMALGAAKYGAFNWQDDPVDATTYYSAAIRHLLQWFSGEDRDPESGASHLAHVRACMAILLDAQASGKLIDDRPKCARAGEAIERLKVTA